MAEAVSPDQRYVLTGGWDGTLRLWSVERGELVREFAQLSIPLAGTCFSDDTTQLWTTSGVRLMRWDLKTGRRIDVVLPESDLRSWAWSPNLRFACTDSFAGRPQEFYLKFWSLDQRRVTARTRTPLRGKLSALGISADGRFCAAQVNDTMTGGFAVSQKGDTIFRGLLQSGECTYTRWNTETGEQAGEFRAQDVNSGPGTRSLSLSRDGRFALAMQLVPDVNLYDFQHHRRAILHDTATGGFDADSGGGPRTVEARLSKDGAEAVISRFDGRVEFWDAQAPRLLRMLQLREILDPICLTPNKRMLIGGIASTHTEEWWEGGVRKPNRGWNSKTLGVWDAETGRKLHELRGHSGPLTRAACDPEERYAASASTDGTTRIWNLETGKEVVQFISFANGEWIAVTPQGYYTASLNGDAYLNVRAGSKITGIEPYRSTFYQPAVVEAALRLGDSERAVSEVLGCKTSCTTIADMPDMEPPYLTVKYPEDGDTLSSADTTLAFHVEDRHVPIQSIKVYVNGRPITGIPTRGSGDARGGIQLDIPAGKQSLDLKVPIRLDEGTNLITIAAVGRSEAVDSVRVFVLSADRLPARMEMDTVWILAVGVNQYEDKRLRDLSYCVNDAQGIVRSFERQEGQTCRKVMSLVISDAGPLKPTFETIVDNIEFLHQAREEDLAVLFLAGHGVSDTYGDFYFLPTDAEVTAPHEFKKSKAISGAMLQAAVEVPARRFVFMDACHSGEVGVDLVKLARAFKDDRVLILTSSEGSKPSEESDSLKHGLFTYALIRGLDGEADITGADARVSAMELIAYVSDKVNTLTKRRQNPVFWAPGGLSNFTVAVARPAAESGLCIVP